MSKPILYLTFLNFFKRNNVGYLLNNQHCKFEKQHQFLFCIHLHPTNLQMQPYCHLQLSLNGIYQKILNYNKAHFMSCTAFSTLSLTLP